MPRHADWRGRLGFLLVATLVCLGCGWMGVQAAYPFALAGRLRDANDNIEREMLRYRLHNQRMERSLKMLDTREGIESAARKQGWVWPRERRLRIPRTDTAASSP